MKNRLIIEIDIQTLIKILSDETGQPIKKINFLTGKTGDIVNLELEIDKKKTVKE